MIDINKANKAFEDYVNSFDMNDDMIKLKHDHTYRVCKQSLEISKDLKLNEENTQLAYLIALLHDVGRFPQATIYHSFNDFSTIDHADLGCEMLFENGLIRDFIDDDKYDDIIYTALKNHNKYEIEECTGQKRLHSEIIRDADKIDIMHNLINLGGIPFNSDNSEISREVRQDFHDKRAVYYTHKKTVNDAVILRLTFVFDFNFKYSYEYLRDNKFIEKMYDKIENKEIFNKYFDEAKEYVEGKCKRVRK